MTLEQALKCCRNHVLWSTMTTSQWWVNVAVISPTLSQPPHPHILQQKPIPVTSDFLSPTTFFVWQEQGRWWQDLLYNHIHFKKNRMQQFFDKMLEALLPPINLRSLFHNLEQISWLASLYFNVQKDRIVVDKQILSAHNNHTFTLHYKPSWCKYIYCIYSHL